MDTTDNKLKNIIAVAVATVVLILLWGGYIIYNRLTTTEVSILIAPSTSHATLNGKKITSGTHRLKKGSYTVVAKKDGFKDTTQNFKVENKTPKEVPILLDPANDETLNWLASNPEGQKVQMEREALGGILYGQRGQALINKNKILEKLPSPFNQKRFAIDYEETDRSPTGIVIQITGDTPQARKFALEQLSKWGYDPADLMIEFFDFKNPLAK